MEIGYFLQLLPQKAKISKTYVSINNNNLIYLSYHLENKINKH